MSKLIHGGVWNAELQEQAKLERQMLYKADYDWTTARYDFLDMVHAVRKFHERCADSYPEFYETNTEEELERMLGRVEQAADKYAEVARELGKVEGRQGK